VSRHVKRPASPLGAAALALLAAAAAEAAQGKPPLVEGPIAFEVASPAEGCAWSGREGEAPLPILVAIDEGALRDPSSLDRLLGCAAERNLAVVARIDPPEAWARAEDPYAALAPWIGDLEKFLQPRRGLMRHLQLGADPEDRFDPIVYSFLLEKVATIAHSIDPGSTVVLGAMGEGSAAWFSRIPPARIAPYIGGIALRDPVDLQAWMARIARDYPGVPVWLHVAPGDAGSVIRRIHAAREGGVRTSVISAGTAPAVRKVVLNLVEALPSRFVADREPPPLSRPSRTHSARSAPSFSRRRPRPRAPGGSSSRPAGSDRRARSTSGPAPRSP